MRRPNPSLRTVTIKDHGVVESLVDPHHQGWPRSDGGSQGVFGGLGRPLSPGCQMDQRTRAERPCLREARSRP